MFTMFRVLKNIGATFITSKNSPDAFSNITITETDQSPKSIAITTQDNATASINKSSAYPGQTVTVTVSLDKDNKTLTVKDSDGTILSKDAAGTYTFAVRTSDVTIEASSKSCITGDTLITLADGTQKRMDEIQETDMVLAFNHETGEYVAVPLLYYVNDGVGEYNVINLKFSDGNVTRLIYEHALFDMTLNRYVYIREDNYNEFIGHEFAKDDGNGGFIRVVLEEGFITEEIVGCYSITSLYHLNYYINGMISLPGDINGLFNYFEYDPTTLKYDEEQMKKDIETYGLYTYEELNALCPLSEELFIAARGEYLKISIGKGIFTEEELFALINSYNKLFE